MPHKVNYASQILRFASGKPIRGRRGTRNAFPSPGLATDVIPLLRAIGALRLETCAQQTNTAIARRLVEQKGEYKKREQRYLEGKIGDALNTLGSILRRQDATLSGPPRKIALDFLRKVPG